MNLAARINLQKGIPENSGYEWTNYASENLVDEYIAQKYYFQRKML